MRTVPQFSQRSSEYERGIECIHKSIKMGPVFPGWFWDPLMRAATLGHMGQIKQAQAAYHELLAINPDFAKILGNMPEQNIYNNSRIL